MDCAYNKDKYRFAKIKSLEDFYIPNCVFNFLIQFQCETSNLHNVDFCFSLARTIQ